MCKLIFNWLNKKEARLIGMFSTHLCVGIMIQRSELDMKSKFSSWALFIILGIKDQVIHIYLTWHVSYAKRKHYILNICLRARNNNIQRN